MKGREAGGRAWRAAGKTRPEVIARWESDDAGWIEVCRAGDAHFEVKDHTGLAVACRGMFAALELAFHRRAELSGAETW